MNLLKQIVKVREGFKKKIMECSISLVVPPPHQYEKHYDAANSFDTWSRLINSTFNTKGLNEVIA